jgi:high-affinity iron transporter
VLSTFLIALREGLEASLMVGILVAYLVKSNRRSALPALWIGVGAAAFASLSFGALLSFSSHHLSARGEAYFSGTSSLIAVAIVTWMVFWMKRTARGMRQDLHGRIDAASQKQAGLIALAAASFFAVVREGLETALFIYSDFRTVSKDSGPAIGLIIGLIAAISLGVALYRQSIKINLAKFFTVTGVALLVVAAGVFSHGINEFQGLGLLPGGSTFAWNWSHSSSSVLATILDGTIGISTTLSVLQLVLWVGYLAAFLPRYLRKAPTVAPAPKNPVSA